jgi:hypothetical protein
MKSYCPYSKIAIKLIFIQKHEQQHPITNSTEFYTPRENSMYADMLTS